MELWGWFQNEKKNCSKFWENLEKNVHFWEFNVLGRKTYERWHCCSIGLAQAALGFSGLLQIYRDSSKPLRETLAPRWGLLRALQSSSRLLGLLRGSSGLLGLFWTRRVPWELLKANWGYSVRLGTPQDNSGLFFQYLISNYKFTNQIQKIAL